MSEFFCCSLTSLEDVLTPTKCLLGFLIGERFRQRIPGCSMRESEDDMILSLKGIVLGYISETDPGKDLTKKEIWQWRNSSRSAKQLLRQ